MSTKRQQILDNLLSSFEGILTSAGYYNDVSNVSRSLKSFEDSYDETDSTSMPAICFAPITTRYQHQACKQIKKILPVTILAHIVATTEAERTQKLSNIEHDIETALMSDIARGASCPAIETQIIYSQTDEFDIFANHRNILTGSILFEIEIQYLRDF